MSPRRVAVVGGGMAGLTAAGLLARSGAEVTLFEQHRLGGKAGSFTHGGLTLDCGPTLLTLPAVVEATFAQLGAKDLLPRFIELDLQCRYHSDDGGRFDVHRSLDATLESARQIQEGEERGLAHFYAHAERIWEAAGAPYLEAPYEGMASFMGRVAKKGLRAVGLGLSLGTLDALARSHLRSPLLQQFVGRFATYAGASPFEVSAAFALIPHLERAFGVHHVVGGMGALAQALGQAVERLGVKLRVGARARWEKVPGGFLVGPPDEEARFDALVVNADPLAPSPDPLPLALSGYVLLLEVDERLSLPHHTVLFGPDSRAEFQALFSGRLPVSPTLYVCHPAASDASMAPAGKSGLFVMANAPPFPPGLDAQALEVWAVAQEATLRQQCLDGVHRHFPALAGRLRVLGERTPRDLLRMGAPGGSIYGHLPHGKFGPFRRPKLRGHVPGLFFAGGGTHPGGGVPLVMLSGRFAAQLVSAHLAEVRA